MKYRDYKNFRRGNYYHVFNRGINKNPIFSIGQDYTFFLEIIKETMGVGGKQTSIKPLPKGSFDIICYCLMQNHFHFLLKQCSDIPVSIFMNKLCTSYVSYYNRKNDRVGPLFQDTYKAKQIENEEYLSYLSAYIHNNPTDPTNYKFSSIKEYIENRKNICNTKYIMELFKNDRNEYRKFLENFVKVPKMNDKKILEI